MPLSLWPCIPSLHYHLQTKDLNTVGEREQEKGKDRADKKSTEMSADSWKRGRKERSEWKKKKKLKTRSKMPTVLLSIIWNCCSNINFVPLTYRAIILIICWLFVCVLILLVTWQNWMCFRSNRHTYTHTQTLEWAACVACKQAFRQSGKCISVRLWVLSQSTPRLLYLPCP